MHNRIFIYIFSILVTILVLSGCKSMSYTKFEVLKPSKIDIPSDINKMVFLYEDINLNSLDDTATDNKNFAESCFDGLFYKIQQTPGYENADYEIINTKRDHSENTFRQLPDKSIDDVFNEKDAELIIALEFAGIFDTVWADYSTKHYAYKVELLQY